MDPTNVPFELISYRGLLKSFQDIKNEYFTNRNVNGQKESQEKLKKSKKAFVDLIRNAVISAIMVFISFIEKILFYLMSCYDDYVYSPLQKCLSPVVKLVPRYVFIRHRRIPIFTANIVTLSRTFLVVPIAWCIKYDYNFWACMCVVFHDFLDHLDGIVAKVQRVTYQNHDDPLLGGFLDAFCDKIVNVLSIWTIIQSIDLSNASDVEIFFYLFISYAVISYESIIGVVRVQDFFLAKFKQEYNIVEVEKKESAKAITAASMEGKLKEKLESTGIALLCMAVSRTNASPINNVYGIIGLVCLLLTLRMAHKSLSLKLKARKELKANKSFAKYDLKGSASVENFIQLMNTGDLKQTEHPNFENVQMKMVDLTSNDHEQETFTYKRPRANLYLEDQTGNDQDSLLSLSASPSTTSTSDNESQSAFDKNAKFTLFINDPNRVDKVYTIGCFDLFHHGHVELIKRMRLLGKKVIVGVHDSRSIYKLKKRVPVDSTEKRMLNVKTLADEVFCIAGVDPSNFITCIVSLNKSETALYVRGDDMPDFPSRPVVENLMPIKFLPYTDGVSSTQIRNEQFSHIHPNDEDYLEKIN